MKIKAKYLRALIGAIVEKHGVAAEFKSLQVVEERIKGVGSNYLYKKILLPIGDMRKNDTVGLRESNLNLLAVHLGFKSIRAFIEFVDNPIDSQLRSLIGPYYTYLRRNTTEGALLRSPVRIFEKEQKVMMELKGERLSYIGELKLIQGTLFVLLMHSDGKCFHHVYKIGSMNTPTLLQGTFSGVTSTFDPIGGRVVLERRTEPFESLKTAAIPIKKVLGNPKENNDYLFLYFKEQDRNNLSINRSTTLGFGDLI